MFCLFVVVGFALPALSAVYREPAAFCGAHEVACGDGACVSRDRRCDGARDCADGSDEHACAHSSNKIDLRDLVLNRHSRQAECRPNQFRCRDGSCINFDGKCDGVVDCPDRSDESHAICRHMPCQSNLFRCTYGACVDGTAPCNGIQECADNSDELVSRCSGEVKVANGKFSCADGQRIPSTDACDGAAQCADGSDEALAACAGLRCAAHLFQCAYGACVDSGADCDGKVDCADGSDESDELCNRTTVTTTHRPLQDLCVLPASPDNGKYQVLARSPDNKLAALGEAFDSLVLRITCNPGYELNTNEYVECDKGKWKTKIPQCIRYCELSPHPSVTYYCGYEVCGRHVLAGAWVRSECNRPNYYRSGLDVNMKCTDAGYFDQLLLCQPECGTISPEGQELVLNGTRAEHGRFPWHAAIYKTTTLPYLQVCGGSLITTTVVLSAAHCFWGTEGPEPPSNYAVALGKIYRPWNNPREEAHKSKVADIQIPRLFAGSAASFQDDIAVVTLSTPVTVTPFIRPVCLDFRYAFDENQLRTGNTGLVAGWGQTESGNASQVLLYSELPFVDSMKCVTDLPATFRPFITSDKICAGTLNGTALCQGDSGGGLVFPHHSDGFETRYYLRGIVSTAPKIGKKCNANAYTTFTHVLKHEPFIKKYT